MNIYLTEWEADALFSCALQMKDNLDYYDYMSKADFKKFVDSYESGMDKLRSIITTSLVNQTKNIKP